MEGYVTAEEAAEILGVSGRRVRAMVTAKQLPAQMIGKGRMMLIARADLDLVKDRKPGRPARTTEPAPKKPTKPATSTPKRRRPD